jgi:hypothetical protein
LNHFVSVASSVGLGKSEHGALNATTIANEDITVVDDTLRQLVAPSEGFSLGSDERNSSASENYKKKSLVHGLCCCLKGFFFLFQLVLYVHLDKDKFYKKDSRYF